MKHLIATLVFVFGVLPPAAQATQTAQVRLYSGSLRFERGYSDSSPILDLSTTYPVLNGELQPYPYAGGVYSYNCLLQLDGLVGSTPPNPPMLGALAIEVPPFGDANNNSYPDFFEVALGASTTNTAGEFVLPAGAGSVVATWSRMAGSPTGTCVMVFTFNQPQTPLTFTHQFTLIEYKGTLTYTPGSNPVPCTFSMTQTGWPTKLLQGVMQFTRPVTNTSGLLTLNAGSWTNENSQALIYPAATAGRLSMWPTNYAVLVEFNDGNPDTIAPDYNLWVLSVDDANDTDFDGIPDLADDSFSSLPRAPHLTMTKTGTNLFLTISGDVGRQHLIQESDSLAPSNWQTVVSLTLPSDPQTVLLGLPTTENRFWRVIAQ